MLQGNNVCCRVFRQKTPFLIYGKVKQKVLRGERVPAVTVRWKKKSACICFLPSLMLKTMLDFEVTCNIPSFTVSCYCRRRFNIILCSQTISHDRLCPFL